MGFICSAKDGVFKKDNTRKETHDSLIELVNLINAGCHSSHTQEVKAMLEAVVLNSLHRTNPILNKSGILLENGSFTPGFHKIITGFGTSKLTPLLNSFGIDLPNIVGVPEDRHPNEINAFIIPPRFYRLVSPDPTRTTSLQVYKDSGNDIRRISFYYDLQGPIKNGLGAPFARIIERVQQDVLGEKFKNGPYIQPHHFYAVFYMIRILIKAEQVLIHKLCKVCKLRSSLEINNFNHFLCINYFVTFIK